MSTIHELTYLYQDKIEEKIREKKKENARKIHLLKRAKCVEKGVGAEFDKLKVIKDRLEKLNREEKVLNQEKERVESNLKMVFDHYSYDDQLEKEILDDIPDIKKLKEMKDAVRETLLTASLNKNVKEVVENMTNAINSL